jgi:hypothetical protein
MNVTSEELKATFEPMGIGYGGFHYPGEERLGNTHRGDYAWGGLSEQVQLAMAWLSLCEKTKKINRRSGSYTLKHECERWAGSYVSNGALLMAAHLLGFRIVRTKLGGQGPNGWINIAHKGRPQRETL